jgi:hypothetical protein
VNFLYDTVGSGGAAGFNVISMCVAVLLLCICKCIGQCVGYMMLISPVINLLRNMLRSEDFDERSKDIVALSILDTVDSFDTQYSHVYNQVCDIGVFRQSRQMRCARDGLMLDPLTTRELNIKDPGFITFPPH